MNSSVIVVDLGGTQARVALADEAARLSHRTIEPTDHARGPESVVGQIVRLAESCLAAAALDWSAISRIAVASPGPLDRATGVVFAPPNMPGWGEVPLGAMLEQGTGVPVTVVNDADAAGLGEFRYGAGKGTRNLIYLTVSTGIGGGIIVDGELVAGSSGCAGEIGHMTVDLHGPRCNCGSVGCLEMLASGTAIARQFQERLAAGARSVLPAERGAQVSAREIIAAAREGDPLALEVFEAATTALGFGIVSCIHIFNPDVVVVGGGVSRAGPFLFDRLRTIVEHHTLPEPRAVVRVLPAALGEDAGLTGAAVVAAEAG